MKITLEEIIQDFYRLAEEEGYFSCLCEQCEVEEVDEKVYHDNILEITEKYIPEYKKFVGSQYFKENIEWDTKGQILSSLCFENFREIFYGIYDNKR